MENSIRSHRTRDTAIQAALTIIARDGPAKLTIDAIARESGISKGGILHQFRTKHEVLRALLRYEQDYHVQYRERLMADASSHSKAAYLASEIAMSQNLSTNPNSAAFAILGALAEDPDLLAEPREQAKQSIEAMKAEAPEDPDLALLRWAAAQGLALMTLFRFNPLSDEERDRLFSRLLDDSSWPAGTDRGKSHPQRDRKK